MIRTRHYGSWTEDPIGLEIPPLPFLPIGLAPPCSENPETFAQAADDSRATADTREGRRRVRAAERRAKAMCATCPVLPGCRAFALETRQRWGVWGGTNHLEREVWARRNLPVNRRKDAPVPAGKFDDVPTIELFSAEALRLNGGGEKAKKRPAPVVARGNCPDCGKEPATLAAQGPHWVWKDHTYLTWGGTTMTCRASGVALCVAPEPLGKPHNAAPLACPHGSEPLAAETDDESDDPGPVAA